MANEGYHEPISELSDETRDMHRAITSLMEELEAVDWYNQRVDACKDDELKAILTMELKSQARPFGEFVPGPDSVPVKKIEPFVKKLARLKVIKRGFEVIDADAPDPRPEF